MSYNFTNRKDLLTELVRTNFKLRYNNSLLGFIWVLLKPLLTFAILYVVFSRFKGGWVENYQIYLLLGIIIYTFINESIVFGMSGILQTAHIILKVNFPREIALISSVIMAVINLIINLFVLIIFSFFNPINPNLISILYFISIMIIIFILTYGISLFTSIILVKLRDLEHITSLFMQLLFYATPIFYPASLLSLKLQKVLTLNPLTVIIQSAREAYIYGRIINMRELGLLFAASLIILFIGNIYFKKQVKKVAEYF